MCSRGSWSTASKSHAFCTPKLDLPHEVCFEEIIGGLREPYQVRSSACGPYRSRLLYTRRRDVPITVMRLDSTRHVRPRPAEVGAVLEFFRRYLEVLRPDVLLTYGGDPATVGMIDLARRREIPVVFAIHNLGYRKAPPLTTVDHRIVASEFACRHYRDKVGLDCHALPNPVDWDRVRVDDHQPRFVTFVNPVLEKGACAFVRIAHELGRRRPDIPLLVVESRGTRENLAALGLGRDDFVNVQMMPNTTDPRRFYDLTRIALLPSLCPENQPLVAVESMINGIPVIGSDRGGIPEVLGDCGFVLPLPDRLTPTGRIVPEADEVEPWVETIIRLWDDRASYQEQSLKARAEAMRWHPDRVRPLYAEFFRDVRFRPEVAVMSGPENGDGHLGSTTAAGVVGTPVRGGGGLLYPNRTAPHPAFGHPLPESGRGGGGLPERPETVPLSFVVCVSDTAILQGNLLASPCLEPKSPHEVISVLNGPSAGAGLNAALERARHEWVVVVHQDVYLPPGWDRRVVRELRAAESSFGPVGIAGVYGVGDVEGPPGCPPQARRIGRVVDRGRVLEEGGELPARVATLDEVLLILPRGTPLRADPALGFHLYGADLCLQAREIGLAVVAVGASAITIRGASG